MVEMGVLGRFTVIGSALNDTKAWDLTEGKVAGALGWQGAGSLGGSDPEIKRFVTDYAKLYPGESPMSFSAVGYHNLMPIVDAVKRAGTATDREKFRDALAKTFVSVLNRKVSWDSPRDKPMGDNLRLTIQL